MQLRRAPHQEHSDQMFSAPKMLLCTVSLSALLVGRSLQAQTVLLAEDHGAMSLVVAASEHNPCVEKNGKIVQIASKGFTLNEVPEYLPVFVSLKDIATRTSAMTDGGNEMNNDFHFNAALQTSYPLDNVFLVLELNTDSNRKVIFLTEIGSLTPNVSRPVSVFLPLKAALGNFTYQVHLYSGGAEVFQTQIPFWGRESALNKMVAKRMDGVQTAAPKFFIGPAPEYPPSLKKANLKGRAVVSIRISPNGSVLDPVVKSATDPAFGQAALVALQDWRFLPKMKDGYAVETKADVPFVFSPPNPEKSVP
jgi:TonB family protein